MESFYVWRLARHKTITTDGFALVACHEIGPHIGGAPRYAGEDWASNEGQADYFATLKCLRRVWQSEDNGAAVRNMTVPAFLSNSCKTQWADKADQEHCVLVAKAGDSVAKLFAALGRNAKAPKFDTPDPKVVTATNDNHPATQCRLDTYFQGALCEKRSMKKSVRLKKLLVHATVLLVRKSVYALFVGSNLHFNFLSSPGQGP